MGSGDLPIAVVAALLVATIGQNVQFVAGEPIRLVGSVCALLLHLAAQGSLLLLTAWLACAALQLLCTGAAAGRRRR